MLTTRARAHVPRAPTPKEFTIKRKPQLCNACVKIRSLVQASTDFVFSLAPEPLQRPNHEFSSQVLIITICGRRTIAAVRQRPFPYPQADRDSSPQPIYPRSRK